jgi:hypothetical protein
MHEALRSNPRAAKKITGEIMIFFRVLWFEIRALCLLGRMLYHMSNVLGSFYFM